MSSDSAPRTVNHTLGVLSDFKDYETVLNAKPLLMVSMQYRNELLA